MYCFSVETSLRIFLTTPYVGITWANSHFLCWNSNILILSHYQVQAINYTTATIINGISIATAFGICLATPYISFAFANSITYSWHYKIKAIEYYQEEAVGNNTASKFLFIGVETCSGIFFTTPFVGITLTDCCEMGWSNCTTFADNNQAQAMNSNTTVEFFFLNIEASFGIFFTTPHIGFALANNSQFCWHHCITRYFRLAFYFQVNHLEVHCSLLWGNDACELVERHFVRLVTISKYVGRGRYRSIVLAIYIYLRNHSNLFIFFQVVVNTQTNISTCCVETSDVEFIELANY